MATIAELCSLIRSKNAGPFVLTFDIMFPDQSTYDRVKRAQPITKTFISQVYNTPEEKVTLVYHDHARAIKASIPRPIFQGEVADGDCYGGQQYVPLMTLEVA